MVGYAKYKNVPAAKFFVTATGVGIILGGLYVALGIYADLGALIFFVLIGRHTDIGWQITGPFFNFK